MEVHLVALIIGDDLVMGLADKVVLSLGTHSAKTASLSFSMYHKHAIYSTSRLSGFPSPTTITP